MLAAERRAWASSLTSVHKDTNVGQVGREVSAHSPSSCVCASQVGFRGATGGSDGPAQGPMGIPCESLRATLSTFHIFPGSTRPKTQCHPPGLPPVKLPHPLPEQAQAAICQNHTEPSSSSPSLPPDVAIFTDPAHPSLVPPRGLKSSTGTLKNQGGVIH